INPDGRHLYHTFGHLEVIHSCASLCIQAGQLLERQLRLACPVNRASRQLLFYGLALCGIQRLIFVQHQQTGAGQRFLLRLRQC
ncbi:hypothetical protein, partial [Salmonella enterica]|uniref:hypothetical protein n=1 Tax=Salmonella enterica TaxID=28901 RepID=UPI0022B66B49